MIGDERSETAKWAYDAVPVEDGLRQKCENEVLEKTWLDYTGEYKAVFAAAMLMICAGTCLQWSGPSLPQLLSPESSIYLTSAEGAYVTSFLQTGAMPGSVIAAISADYFGRRKTIISLAFPFLAGQIIMSFATNVTHLYISRIISGFSVGAAFALIPMYISEVSSPKIRGIMGTAVGMFNNFGGLFQYLVGLFNPINVTACVAAIFPILFLMMVVWLPESPYYCLLQENEKEAERSLQQLRGTKDVKSELHRLQEAVEIQKQVTRGNIFDAITNRTNLKVLGVITGLFFFQQTAGIVPIFAYSQVIFNKIKMRISPETCGIMISLTNFLVTLLTASLVDCSGRRQVFLISTLTCVIPLSAFGLFFYFLDHGYDVSMVSLTPVFALIAYKFSWGLGLGTLPYICSGELLATRIKAFGSCYVSVLGSLFGFIIMKMFQVMVDTWGYPLPFFIFSANCLAGAVFVYFLLPETRGRTLEEIQEDLRKK